MTLKTSDFDYILPEELIAQVPVERRDSSRLMVLRRGQGEGNLTHRVFSEITELLHRGDVLVVNNTRVIPAKFAAVRATGGKIGGLFCRELAPGQWEVMLRGAGRCRNGEMLHFAGCDDYAMTLGEHLDRGRWSVQVEPAASAMDVLSLVGSAPLPPYIRRGAPGENLDDQQRYQTVYAARPGAVAAPTAGLHLTRELMDRLADKGVEIESVTLHVGPGTFTPVTHDDLGEHRMHSEWYELTAASAERLNRAKRQGRRIVAVGTTSVRVLETVARGAAAGGLADRELFAASSGWTDIFIYPPADFHAVDALITNFHLPRSTLLMLIAAFCNPGGAAGVSTILNAYAQAVQQQYRFYSYGDAMFIE